MTLGARIRFNTEGTKRAKCANRRFTITLTSLANTILAYIHIGGKHYLTINSQTGFCRTALHVIYFE